MYLAGYSAKAGRIMDLSTMLSGFLRGLLLGIGAAAPIGPVNVEIARRTLRRGFRAGFALGCGAVTVDVVYSLLIMLGIAHLSEHPAFYWPLHIVGAILLAYLGVRVARDAIRAARAQDDPLAGAPAEAPRGTFAGGYLTGLAMTFFNPMTLLFWFTSVPAALGPATSGAGRADLPIICSGVFVATISWVVFFTSALKWLRQWRRQWWMTAADALGACVLLGFAGYAFWTSLARFL
jgi:threonine/homoserine/homoserine lactone efflux protein